MTGGLDNPVREPGFLEVEARVFDPDEAASAADISTMESSSDSTTCLLLVRAGCFLGFLGGTVTFDGSGLGGMEDLVVRVGASTSSASSSCPALASADLLTLPVVIEVLEVSADRPFRGRGSCCITSSLTAVDPPLAVPRLRLTGGGESSTGCSSSSVSGTSLSADFDRAETRVREVADGCFFVREGGFSTISSLSPPSTSDRPRFLRDVEAFSSGGSEADTDRVARRGGMGKSESQR